MNAHSDHDKPASKYVTLVEVFELIGSVEEYRSAISALADRAWNEAPEALVTYQFYADPASREAGAVITFADPDAFTKHISLISDWDEFRRFAGTTKLVDIRIYGAMSAQGQAWLAQSPFQPSKIFPRHVTGFVRAPA
jgi:hypothetical protein